MVQLVDIVSSLNREFKINEFGKDPAFSRFIPKAYNNDINWKKIFEPNFIELFNGLMIKGYSSVCNVFLAVFPTAEILEKFIEMGDPGDLLFMHHPLTMECGDPRGKWGRGFVHIEKSLLERVVDKGLSIYTCHAPMDYHRTLGTSQAIAEKLGIDVTERFIHNEKHGDIGIIGDIKTTNTIELIEQLKCIFEIPYVDFEGINKSVVKKVAVIAGCGDKVNWMEEAERKGVEAYISGEIHCHIDNDYGKERYQQIKDFANKTNMSLIGVSHSASEYLVKKTLMYRWFKDKFNLNVVLIPQNKWWL
ncbi:Nif3-like dinuclear metal center hexameric protein [Chengkuizengella axinellae]|uniref:GTP cyclohydrolase 1 type 2 homolog n=1 Tax=Chengkuizengella axinellae TaxID=3064388 RepID=A0ABT9IZW1_9BACL|nr:Nif3-like dinuclear metal center hexameric protein [Chengkuizengella sp. 2205SS18-9]MDP5274914.1 Nif3-like dinuclear metal center hexameric protein [Chengkuizengella sp. 2205SS18-9]